MAGDAYGFDEKGVRRIIKTVRDHERAPQQLPRHNSAPGPSSTDRCWLVRVAGSGSTGDPQTPDGNNLIPGTVLHVDPSASTSSGSCFETGGDCKILVASPIGAAPELKKGDQYVGRFSGLLPSGDPLIVIDVTEAAPLILVQTTGTLSQGGNCGATIMEWTGSVWDDTGASITIYDSANYGPLASTRQCYVQLSTQSAQYEIVSLPPGGTTKLVKIYGGSCDANDDQTGRIYTGTPGSETYSSTDLTFWNRGPGILLENLYGLVNDIGGNWYWSGPANGMYHTGTASGTISAGATGGSVLITDGSGTSTGITVSAKNTLMTTTISNGTKVNIAHNGKEWIIISLAC